MLGIDFSPPPILTTNPLVTQLLTALCSHRSGRPDLPPQPFGAPGGLRTNSSGRTACSGWAGLGWGWVPRQRELHPTGISCFPEFPSLFRQLPWGSSVFFPRRKAGFGGSSKLGALGLGLRRPSGVLGSLQSWQVSSLDSHHVLGPAHSLLSLLLDL